MAAVCSEAKRGRKARREMRCLFRRCSGGSLPVRYRTVRRKNEKQSRAEKSSACLLVGAFAIYI